MLLVSQSLSAPPLWGMRQNNNYLYVFNFDVALESYYLEVKLWRFLFDINRLCHDTLIDLPMFHHAKNNLALGAELDKIIVSIRLTHKQINNTESLSAELRSAF